MTRTTNKTSTFECFIADVICALCIVMFFVWAANNSTNLSATPYYYDTAVGVTTKQHYVLESINGNTKSECILPSASTLKTLRVVLDKNSQPLFQTQFDSGEYNSFNGINGSTKACVSGSFKAYISEHQLLEFLEDYAINVITTYPNDPNFNQTGTEN